MNEDKRKYVEELLFGKTKNSSEQVVQLFFPDEHKVMTSNSGCFACLGKTKWDTLVKTNEIYLLTNSAVYTIVDKKSLKDAAEPLKMGDKVAGLPDFERIGLDVMERVGKVDKYDAVSLVSTKESGGKRLLWSVSQDMLDMVVTMVQSTHEQFAESMYLASLPTGALENRIAHN